MDCAVCEALLQKFDKEVIRARGARKANGAR
jgi:hypothetical protein